MKITKTHGLVTLSMLLSAFASVGLCPLSGGGCGPVQVVDPATGKVRPASPDEVLSLVAPSEQSICQSLAASGQSNWALALDAVTRLGALGVALYSGWKIPAPGSTGSGGGAAGPGTSAGVGVGADPAPAKPDPGPAATDPVGPSVSVPPRPSVST
jgi:hypothetical protein